MAGRRRLLSDLLLTPPVARVTETQASRGPRRGKRAEQTLAVGSLEHAPAVQIRFRIFLGPRVRLHARETDAKPGPIPGQHGDVAPNSLRLCWAPYVFSYTRLCTRNVSRALIERPYSREPQAVGAVREAQARSLKAMTAQNFLCKA